MNSLTKAMLGIFFCAMSIGSVVGVTVDGVDLGFLGNPDITVPQELQDLCKLDYNVNNPLQGFCVPQEKKLWSYGGRSNGPCLWGLIYPNCYGNKQSPIDIDSAKAQTNQRKIALDLKNYGENITDATLVNDGRMISLFPNDGIERSIMINGMKYVLKMVHFHYNENITIGSEHAIDGKKYAFEVHFFHQNSRNQAGIVAVLYTTALGEANFGFKPIVTILDEITYKGQETKLKLPLNLTLLLPESDVFYRYQGSITFPPCNQAMVVWSVFREPSRIGKNQLSNFFKLYSVTQEEAMGQEACKLDDTTRPLQKFNGRNVVLANA